MEALISFRHPLVLFLELVPAALLVAVFRDRGRRLVLPLDHGVAGKRTRLRFLVRPFETIPALLLANAVLHWVPLTTDTSAFRCAPPFMRPGQLPMWFGGTEIGRALLACRKILVEREEGDRMIVLVTDGYSADLGGDRDQEIARSLQRDGIVVYSIHIAETEVPEPIVTITALTGGEVFQPGDQEGLAQIFRRIDQMQQTKLEKVRSEALDWYEPFCLAGLGLLGVALLGLFGLRHTPW
jgi:Ca-activated chloride channel family protein